MIKAKGPSKISVQYEGEESGASLVELILGLIFAATICKVIFSVTIVDAAVQWWHFVTK